jgi:chaperonin cofactor prefoldin
MKKPAFLVFMFLILNIGTANAINTVDSQEDIFLNIERGRSYTFPLLLENIQLGETITSHGGISSWIGFGSNNEDNYTLNAFVSALPVNISVPDSAEIGEYSGDIRSGETIISRITVSVTLSAHDIITLQGLSDVNARIAELESRLNSMLDSDINDIRNEINTIKDDLSLSITNVINYNKNVTSLEEYINQMEEDKENLENRISGLEARAGMLESENQGLEFTGNVMRGQSPVIFVIGIVLGVAISYIFLKRFKKAY